jgi:hypothetical protein
VATSKVAIANLALQKLGAKRISALDQDHANARSMNAAFNMVRDAELRRYAWGFSIRRASIAADASQTVWGDWNRYSLPNDYIRLVRDNETGQRVDWRIESGTEAEGVFIVTADASPLEIRYIARIQDPNFYDSLFDEAFASRLAAQCCKEITGSSSAAGQAMDDYKVAIAEAKQNQAIEKEAQDEPEDDWLAARR